MEALERFYPCFSENTYIALEKLFGKAQNAASEKEIEELQNELNSILCQEKTLKQEISPSGKNHIVVTEAGGFCLLINIYGIHVIFDSVLFCEGELCAENFHWIEKDNLVLFDVCYIVHDECKKCICHYDDEDFFVHFSKIEKKLLF